MKITKETIKETLRSIMNEESEYAIFFKKALEKAGKSITDMSDDEKKTFFNKIDAAWNGKGEKNEALVGNQSKLDIDGDGEIEASDLAALRAGKKKEETVNEEEIRWNAVQNAIINFLKNNTKILDKRVQAKDIDGVKGGLNSIISGLTNAQRSLKLESVNEDYDGPAILKTGDKNALKVGEKITINSGGKKKEYKVVKSNGNGDFVLHLVKESVNEEIKVGQMVKVVNNPHWEAALGKKGPFKRKVKGIYGDSVFFTDGSNSDMKYIKESVNEALWPKSKLPQSFQFALAPELKKNFKGIFYSVGNDIYHNDKKVLTVDGDKDSVNSIIKQLKSKIKESVNEYNVNKKFGSKYDIGAGSMGNGTTFWNRAEEEFGDYKKIAHVSDNGVVKFYDKTLPSNVKKHIEDYAKTKKESVNEGRGFVAAAKKAKEEGKTEFEYKGKKYPVTIK